MKHLRKVLALVLAAFTALVVATPAFADGSDGKITVTNATLGETYKAYKILDATVNDNAQAPNNIAYTTTSALKDVFAAEGSPWTVATTADSNGNYAVTSTADAATISAWIKNNLSSFNAINATVGVDSDGKATATTVEFGNLAYGYYYITSSLGAEVTIDSANKTANVIDKNQQITLDKQEKIANGTWVYEGIDAVEDPVPTAKVGDTVNYKVVGTISQYVGTDKVTKLTFTDVMSKGLTADQNVSVKVGTRVLQQADGLVVNYSTDATTGMTTTTIVFPTVNSSGEFLYDNNAEYEITYSAKINENAIERDEENNTVDLKYTDDNNNDKEVDTDETKVKDYKITLTKQDGSSKAKLSGAEFKLYDAATEGNEIALVLVTGEGKGDGTAEATANNVYRPAKAGETGVAIVTSKTGIVEIQGLSNGDYYFEETVAPKGYNKLDARTQVTTITNANATIDVDNNQGTELPSTGGMGTTILYTLGGILVVGGAIFLIAKNRSAKMGA